MTKVVEEGEQEEDDIAASEECESVDTFSPLVAERREVGKINNLPEELLLQILLTLQPPTLLKVTATCLNPKEYVDNRLHLCAEHGPQPSSTACSGKAN